MLWNMNSLRGCGLDAADGGIGTVGDILFDDAAWAVRYLIVDTGGWLTGRSVLISPAAVGAPDPIRGTIPTTLTREQVRGSPDIDTKLPVSRRQELELTGYYGWPRTWSTPGMVGGALAAGFAGRSSGVERYQGAPEEAIDEADPHLRSARAIEGYVVAARDGDIGRLEDICGDDRWNVRYFVVERGTNDRTLLSTAWVDRIDWETRSIGIDLPSAAVIQAPRLDRDRHPDRDFEAAIYAHYARQPYWRGD